MSFSFSSIKRRLSGITITALPDGVRVSNIDGFLIKSAIGKHWSSNSIPEYLIRNVKANSFEIDTFFLPDVAFTIKQMVTMKTRKVLPVMVLSKLYEKLKEETWLNKIESDYPTKLKREKLKDLTFEPKDYQSNFLDNYDQKTQRFRLNGFLLNGAAGSGKTAASLMLSHLLDEDVTVIVSPKNAIYQVWDSHMQRLFKKPPSYWIADKGSVYNNERYLIVHYEKLEHLLSLASKFTGKRVTIILDESHNLNTIDSGRTELFLKFCTAVASKNVLWMSGTPFKAITKEAIPLFRSIDPTFSPDVEFRFKKIYRDTIDRGVEIIRNRLGLISFIIEKKELKLLPPIFEDIRIKIPNGQKFTLENIKKVMVAFVEERTVYYKNRASIDKALFDKGLKHYENTLTTNIQKEAFAQYRKMLAIVIASGGDFMAAEEMKFCNAYEKKEIIPCLPNEWRALWKDVRSAVKYVKLKIQGEALGRVLGQYRIEAHVAMVPYIPFETICDSTSKKTVVFSTFQKVLEAVGDHLKPTDFSPLFVYGHFTSKLKEIVNEFRTNEDVNPLCATYASLSTAVPLTMADTMILIDVPWRDYVLQQAVSRIHRLDSDTQTTIYRCELDTGTMPNISTRSVDVLAWSQNQIEEILGIKSPYALKPENADEVANLEGFDLFDNEAETLYYPTHYLDKQ
jgi:hypothetical protein